MPHVRNTKRRPSVSRKLKIIMAACFGLAAVLVLGGLLLKQQEILRENAAAAEQYAPVPVATETGTEAATDPRELPDIAGELIWSDTFGRPDGAPGVAESGQEYLTHNTNQQAPLIVDGALASVPQAEGSTGSGYVAVRLEEEPVHIVQKFTISGEGDGQNSAVSIVPGHGSTIPEIIDRDVHAIHTRNGVAVQIRNAATEEYVTVDSWPLTLERGDTEYTWSITRTAPDTIRVVDALGVEHFSTHPDYAELWGPDVYIQAVNQANATPPGDSTTVTEVRAYSAK